MTATVICMNTKRKIEPNRRTFEHGGQKYTCIFDPNAPPNEQWVWVVDYTYTMKFIGSASSLNAASVSARKEIHRNNKLYMMREEEDVREQ